MPDHVQVTHMSDHVQVTHMPDHVQVTHMPDHVQVTHMPDHVEVTHMPDHVQVTHMPDHVQVTHMPDHVHVTHMPDHVQVTHMSELDWMDAGLPIMAVREEMLHVRGSSHHNSGGSIPSSEFMMDMDTAGPLQLQQQHHHHQYLLTSLAPDGSTGLAFRASHSGSSRLSVTSLPLLPPSPLACSPPPSSPLPSSPLPSSPLHLDPESYATLPTLPSSDFLFHTDAESVELWDSSRTNNLAHAWDAYHTNNMAAAGFLEHIMLSSGSRIRTSCCSSHNRGGSVFSAGSGNNRGSVPCSSSNRGSLPSGSSNNKSSVLSKGSLPSRGSLPSKGSVVSSGTGPSYSSSPLCFLPSPGPQQPPQQQQQQHREQQWRQQQWERQWRQRRKTGSPVGGSEGGAGTGGLQEAGSPRLSLAVRDSPSGLMYTGIGSSSGHDSSHSTVSSYLPAISRRRPARPSASYQSFLTSLAEEGQAGDQGGAHGGEEEDQDSELDASGHERGSHSFRRSLSMPGGGPWELQVKRDEKGLRAPQAPPQVGAGRGQERRPVYSHLRPGTRDLVYRSTSTPQLYQGL